MTQRVADAEVATWTRRVHDWTERVLKGSLNQEEIAQAVQRIIDRGALFILPYQQLNLTRQRNATRSWGFADEQFKALGEPPAWPEDRLAAVVLDVSLGSVQQTCEEAWYFTCQAQQDLNAGHWRWDGVKSDPEHLRLLESIVFQPMTLQWRGVDLAANWDKKHGVRPRDVRSPASSPHSAVLWAASYFPKWVQAIDGTTVPYVWLPGYELSVAGRGPWSSVPCLGWYRDDRGVRLDAFSADDRYGYWAVPAFRE